MYNTRIAPSPTGFMHIGTARTAYFNYLAARASDGKFILRIDDTDAGRTQDGAVDIIFDSIEWLGLDYDFCFFQSDRFYRYIDVANDFVKNGLAKILDNGAIALCMDDPLLDVWTDSLSGNINISDKDRDNVSDMILMKGGDNIGSPIYHFASVVDDFDYNINYIIRGTDHISNTPKQLAIWNALNKISNVKKDFPKFSHVGLIHKNKKKMSKRDAATDPTIFLSYYKDNNYDPDAVLNFLARLGWGPTIDDKSTVILDKDDMIRLFLDHGKMRAAPSNFDMDKLNSFDRKYKARKN